MPHYDFGGRDRIIEADSGKILRSAAVIIVAALVALLLLAPFAWRGLPRKLRALGIAANDRERVEG